MLEKIDSVSLETTNMIIYTDSAVLQSLLRKKIKQRFAVDRYFTIYANSAKELKEGRDDSMYMPFVGGSWMLNVNTDSIQLSDIAKSIPKASRACIAVYWVSKYSTYKKLLELDNVKDQSVYCYTMYAGKLYPEDVTYLHNELVTPANHLPKDLLEYVKKNYMFNVKAVCELFQLLERGEKVKTTKDIIALIGIGGNTIDSFVIKLLTLNPKTNKSADNALQKALALLKDLGCKHTYAQIKAFMLSTLNAILGIKELQIQGKYSTVRKDIDDTVYDVRKMEYLKRFEVTILEEINIARVLNLKSLLINYTGFEFELSLVQVITAYIASIQFINEKNPESKEQSSMRKYSRRRAT